MNQSDAHAYDDIIHLPHHVSQTRPHMSLEARAAQFAPFAALSGFGEAIAEANRKSQEEVEAAERGDPYDI